MELKLVPKQDISRATTEELLFGFCFKFLVKLLTNSSEVPDQNQNYIST